MFFFYFSLITHFLFNYYYCYFISIVVNYIFYLKLYCIYVSKESSFYLFTISALMNLVFKIKNVLTVLPHHECAFFLKKITMLLTFLGDQQPEFAL